MAYRSHDAPKMVSLFGVVGNSNSILLPLLPPSALVRLAISKPMGMVGNWLISFVIAGGGTGRNVYRRLQRQGIAFMTGILFQNDLDYPVAKALAAEVIEAEGFEPITDGLVEAAKKKMDICKRVICCKESFGSLEQANKELLRYAKQTGKEVEMGNYSG